MPVTAEIPPDVGRITDRETVIQMRLAAVQDWIAHDRASSQQPAADDGDKHKPLTGIGAAAFAANIPQPDYLLDGIIAKGYVYSITGQTGAGKTAIAIALAGAMAAGREFAGRETRRCSVLYVASENPDDVRARLLAWAQAETVDLGDIDDWLFFIDESFLLADRIVELIAEIERLGVECVILDTDQAIAGSEDENSNSERIAHAKRVRQLSRAITRPGIIDLCHPPQAAGRIALRPRGGGAFLAEIDGNIGLWRDDTTDVVELFRTLKFRGPEFEPLQFDLQTVAVRSLTDAKGRPITSVVAVPITAADDIAKFDAGQERTLAVLRDLSMVPSCSQRQRADRLGMPRATVQRIIAELADRRAIAKSIDGYDITERGKRWLVAAA